MNRLTVLTPEAAIVVTAAALPLIAFALAARRSERARSILRLPGAAPDRRRPLLIGAAFALFAVAAAQPALERIDERAVRTDAEALVVLDVSRSMAASAAPGSTTRLERAKDVALRVRERLDTVPVGLATLTDRVLSHVLPTPDAAVFAAAVQKTVGIERPRARDRALQATALEALAQTTRGRYFSPGTRRRLLVVVTDGDSAPVDAAALAEMLRAGSIRLELVRVGDTSERVYDAGGLPEPLYRPSPTAARTLDGLATAAGGVSVTGADTAARAAADFLGRGPTTTEGAATRVVSLAWLFVLAALVPLGLLVGEGLLRAQATMRFAWPRAAPR
jgi:hypothetical protein